MFRALNRAGVKSTGDLVFLASAQEEIGCFAQSTGWRPDMFIAVDLSADQVWYGALRISMFTFFYTSLGAHTLESRGAPSPAKAVAKAILSLYDTPLPNVIPGVLPVINAGTLGGGTVVNAIPREAWFTVDLRSLARPSLHSCRRDCQERR